MSGICGIAFYDRSRTVGASDVSSMVRALRFPEQEEGRAVYLGPIGMGVQTFLGYLGGVEKLIYRGDPLILALYGNLYNLKEFLPSGRERENPVLGLLHLYIKDGIDFLKRLRGEFAVSLWDGSSETLYLATDRFRVHPLFYYRDENMFVFSSRMQGILACPIPQKRTISPEAIVDVAACSVIPTPKSIFQEVKKLPPAHLLTSCKGEVRVAPYWEIGFLEPSGAGEAELTRTLKSRLADAVSVRVAWDGDSDRIGSFLSGGIDSSTLTGLLSRQVKNSIKSFSIGFDEERFNEISFARIVAQEFGVKHYEYFVTPADTYEAIPVLMGAFDEPYANASAVPTYFCAKMAKDHGIDILYAGDGGDELFAGNERYADQRLFDYYYDIPGWLRESLIKPFVFTLADRLNLGLFVKGKKYIQRASIPYPQRLTSYGLFKTVPMSDFFEADFFESIGASYDPYDSIYRHYRLAPAQTELDRQLYIDLKAAISDNDLFKVTRMTEAAGVGVRFPFMDHPLAEFAASVPAKIKMKGRDLRSFFKKAYADLLPSETLAKKKHGFGLPIPIWLRTDKRLNDLMHDLVLSRRSLERGYFRRKTLEELVEFHKSDKTSFYGTILWNLMVLELWHRIYLESDPSIRKTVDGLQPISR